MKTWTIDGLVPKSRTNQRWHWAQKRRHDQAWHRHVHAVSNYGEVQGKHRVKITQYRAGKLLDPDNLYASVKPIVDGLVRCGWLVDDSLEFLDLVVDQVHVRKKDVRTVIEWS